MFDKIYDDLKILINRQNIALEKQQRRISGLFILKFVSCKDMNHQRFLRTTVHGREREMNRTDEALIAATLPTYVNAFAQASRDTHYSTHTARTWTRKGRIDSDDTRPEIHRNVSPWKRFESTVTLAKITNVARSSFNRPQVSIAKYK